MSTPDETRLPIVSESQRIGRLANKAFMANVPNAWLYDRVDGDNDFGYDYQIQVETEGLVKDSFRLQLKGTTAPTLDVARAKFSVSLNVATVNYYARATEPVLLVLCDLSVDIKHPKNCPLYYQWIQDDLQRVRDHGVTEEQKSLTFHIPLGNVLLDSTDLTADLERFRRIAKAGEQLDVVVQHDHPALSPLERSIFISKLAPGLAPRSSALLDALADDPTSSWVEASKGTLQWHLQQAMNALRIGDTEVAQEATQAAEKLLDGAKPLEEADYWHAVGRLRSQLLDDAGARDAYDNACRHSGDVPRHLVPWAESDLRLRFQLDGPNDYSQTLERLTGSEPSVLGMRARLLAAEGNYADALATAKGIEGVDGTSARAIVYSMLARSDEVISECDAGLSFTDLRDSTKQLFLILRARAKFAQAIGESAIDERTGELPFSGPAGAKADLLHSTWKDIATSIAFLRTSGWPGNVEQISDIWTATASMLGLQRETLPLMAEAAIVRPTLSGLQAGVESLAAQVGEFKLALEANARQPHSDYTTLRRIALLHLADQHKNCVDQMFSSEESLSESHHLYGYSIGMAILSADRIVRPDLAVKWETKLASLPEHAPNLALVRFFRSISHNPLTRDEALAELERQHEALGHPLPTGMQLFRELDATDPKQAARCIAIAQQLTSKRLLDVEGSLHLAQALVTIGHWEELLDLSNQTTTRFDYSDQLTAIGALALDKLGRSAEAHDRLQGLIEKPDPNELALNTFIAIASRSGFTTEAVACLEQVLAREQNPLKQLECLRHLFSLIHLSEPNNPRLVDIASEIGRISDHGDEAQEGLYLMTMFTATLPADMPLDDTRKAEFHQRLAAFGKRFPDSKILRRATIPDDATPEQLIQIIRKLAGIDDEHLKWREIIEEQLRRGVTPCPYAWRPRNILNGISDLPTLWEVSKSSRCEDHQLHLTMVGADWKAVPPAKMRGQVPLLDLTALLVLLDLGLLDALFLLFPKIAIGKTTLLEIQQLLSPISVTPFRNKLLDLQLGLKAHFACIEQPGVEVPEERLTKAPQRTSEEFVELARSTGYMLYTDDLFLRIFSNPSATNPPSICTLDVLLAMDEVGILSVAEVARHIATLSSWHVGLVVTLRYQLAILPDGLSSAKNINDGINILRNDTLCNALFKGLWDLGKPYEELQGHAGAMLRELVADPKNRIQSIQALLAFWLNKARLHRKAPMPVERVLALLIMQAAYHEAPISEVISQRLWSVYKALVETVHGDHMDDEKYDYSIKLAGQIAAEVDQHRNLEGDRAMRQRLGKGLTSGTSDSDFFDTAYTKALISKVKKIPS